MGHNEKENDARKIGTVNAFTIILQTLRTTFRKMWYVFVLLAVVAVGAALLELIPPLILKRLVDDHLKAQVQGGVWILAAYYLLASIGSSILGFGQVFVTTYIGQNILLQLRLRMADQLSRLPLSYYNRTPVGETMSRITSDVDAVNFLFSSGLVNALTDFVKVFGIIAAMYAISPALCGIALVSVPVVYFVANYFRKSIFQAQMGIRKAVGGINTFLQETLGGMKIIKAYGMEEKYRERFQTPLQNHLEAINHAAVYESYFPCIIQIIRAITIAVIVWIGAGTGTALQITVSVGSLAAMADLVTRLFGPVEALSQEFQTMQQAMAGLRRIVEFLHEETEEKGERQHIDSFALTGNRGVKLSLNGIVFGYQPSKKILDGISLEVRTGDRIAIVGRTGAGKTSLMNLIAGLYKPWEGSISVSGLDPYRIEASERRRLIGVVPQNVHIFEGTVRENITLRDQTLPQHDVERAAKTVGLHDYIMSLEQGYDTLLGVAGAKLSFGQSQLLSLARAIVSDPILLLLDEPTSGMDAVTEAAIFKALRAASENRTILTISHRLSGILDADKVYIMAEGRIVQSGSPEELAGRKGWYSVFRQIEDLGWKMD